MKKLAIFCALLIGVSSTAEAAQAVNPRGRTSSSTETTTATDATRTSTATARSATTARSAVSTRSTTSSSAGTTARAATAGRTTVSRTPTTATSSTTSAARSATVTARAATTQKVLNTGTTINAANENVMVSEACRQKYYGCMDSFCMLDNDSGGRCICSDKNAEYDEILAQIEELDQQSYQMATYGVERIEMGDAADVAIASANSVAQSILNANKEEEEEKQTLDLTSWFSPVDFDSESIFDDTDVTQSPIEGKEGDELYKASHDICIAQMPECENELSMLQLMYAQQIRSDCSAYENSLKQQKNASAQKLYAAEQALRDAALEQYQTANKYDLGQCTVEFKNCMISTGGCGDDFSGCASIAAFDSTSTRGNKDASTYEIQGATTSIEIKSSTYDILLSKKPLCENVTKQCQLVADQVWDTFLKEVAPQVKSAELIAEDNARQSCISNISSCFQQACKDTIDPNDPDGSYDLCLTRPETMLNLCQVPLNACGISTESAAKAEKSEIWGFVVARLSSMRVDSCTTQFKECLQSEDRCGEDYSQCIGLDLATVREMCPLEKLVGCQKDGELNSMADIDSIIQGIYLQIDNSMLTQCQNKVNEKMVELCGDTSSCNIFSSDANIGKSSLLSYKDGRTGNYIISGLISYSNISLKQDDNGYYSIDVGGYMDNLAEADDASRERIENALNGIQNEIKRRVDVLALDPEISMCVSGRDISQIKNVVARNTTGRFPHLLDAYTNVIANSVLETAKTNYDREYASMFSEAISAGEDYKNQIYCNAIAQGDDYTATNLKNRNSGIKEANDWSVTINGATDEQMLAVLTESAAVENVLLDTSGRMIGKQTITNVYEPGSSTCRITTTTYPCTGFEAIYNYDSSSFGVEAGASFMGIGGNAGYSQSKATNEYKGNFCSSYAEPVISEQLISFVSGSEAKFSNTTRSNLQSYYNDTSSNITQENDTGGFSLGLSVGGNIGIGNKTNVANDGSSINNSATSTSNNNASTSSSSSSNSSSSGSSGLNYI